MKQLGFDTSGCATLSAALETSQMTRRVGGENYEQNNKVWAKSFLIYSNNLSPTGLCSTKDKDTPITKRPTQQHVIVQKSEVVPQSNWCPAENEKATINSHVPSLFKHLQTNTCAFYPFHTNVGLLSILSHWFREPHRHLDIK